MATSPRYQLFYSLRSPFARRVRVAMQRLSLSYESKEINVFEPTDEFSFANPLGFVPVLTVSDGVQDFSIPDSSTILEYLQDNFNQKIWPSDPGIRNQVRAASAWAEGLMTHTVALFLERSRTSPAPEWEKDHLDALSSTLRHISRTSVFQMPWKVSTIQLTQAGYDLAIALEYLQLRAPDLTWAAEHPKLSEFLEIHRVRQDLAPTAPPR